MKNVSRHIVLVILFFIPLLNFAQSSTDKLKKERDRLEKNISNTKSLLEKTQSTAEVTLNELKLIDNQVKFREELLQNFDNQIRGTELKIEQKNMQIKNLETKLSSLKIQYRKLLIYAYKKRSKQGKMMFLFSSTSYYEALKRKKYLDKIAEIQRKQKLIILQHKRLIAKEKGELVEEKDYKVKIADEKRSEKDEILKDKQKQATTLSKLKQVEQKLLADLQKDIKKRESYNSKIEAALIAENKKVKAAEKKEASKGTKNTKKTSSSDSKSTTTASKTKEITFTEPKEVTLNSNFEGNKGKLPWPVATGSITENFGKNAHAELKGIVIYNNGIDISTNKGAQVRAVFEGEVTMVMNIIGAGKTVFIKHGNYRTVYSNLQDVYVTKGDKVNTKQAIGSLLVPEEGALSVLHFELRQEITPINPSLWISR